MFVLGFFSTAFTAGETEPLPDLAVFDWRALVVAGLTIIGAEALGLWPDRRPVMPDVDAYTRRMVALHVTIIVGALLLTVLGSVALAASSSCSRRWPTSAWGIAWRRAQPRLCRAG